MSVDSQDREAGSVGAQLFIAGFSGAGSYLAAGTVELVATGLDPIVVPIGGQATVDDDGSGSLSIEWEGQKFGVTWTC